VSDQWAEIKARWFTDDLHRAEYWADLASRDVPWLLGEVERLRLIYYAPTGDNHHNAAMCPYCTPAMRGAP
jgi:hypothetical protein